MGGCHAWIMLRWGEFPECGTVGKVNGVDRGRQGSSPALSLVASALLVVGGGAYLHRYVSTTRLGTTTFIILLFACVLT